MAALYSFLMAAGAAFLLVQLLSAFHSCGDAGEQNARIALMAATVLGIAGAVFGWACELAAI